MEAPSTVSEEQFQPGYQPTIPETESSDNPAGSLSESMSNVAVPSSMDNLLTPGRSNSYWDISAEVVKESVVAEDIIWYYFRFFVFPLFPDRKASSACSIRVPVENLVGKDTCIAEDFEKQLGDLLELTEVQDCFPESSDPLSTTEHTRHLISCDFIKKIKNAFVTASASYGMGNGLNSCRWENIPELRKLNAEMMKDLGFMPGGSSSLRH
ncbi:hypothetical protein QFC19_001277 [Naganishia cerealis]|uniref:Uncharacterized protein n=1 Tax=Naganishia cerealis TaxID=610337 RepID=A0ACC2WIP0_9TREE|nr:hypothetical protein QFC19_001277 [Naganishia cerealis]